MTMNDDQAADFENDDDLGFNPYGSGPVPIAPRDAGNGESDDVPCDAPVKI